MAVPKISSNLTKWLPAIAVIGGIYQVYQDRGFQGLIDDLTSALTYDAIVARWQTWAMGLALIFLAKPISGYVPSPTMRPIVTAILYYVGIQQLATAIQQGAASGGRGSRGWIIPTQMPGYTAPTAARNTGSAGRL